MLGCGGVLGVLVLGVVGAVVLLRLRQKLYFAKLQRAVTDYAASRGGSVTFEGDVMVVEGPRGEGRERMTALQIMCKPGDEERWPGTIGFSLRKYIPDAFDDAFAESARKELQEALPGIEALSRTELGAALRLKLCSERAPREGLAVASRPIGDRFEARVVVDGFAIDGIPEQSRARLSGDDSSLFELALAQTLPTEAPAASAGECTTPGAHAWLCAPDRIFGLTPHVIVGAGDGLAWAEATPAGAEAALVRLAGESLAKGPMKGTIFGWDGSTLTQGVVVNHTIMGPTTPDFTVRLPAPVLAAMGIVADARGDVGVRRPR